MSVVFSFVVEFLLTETPINLPSVRSTDFSCSKITWLEAEPVSVPFLDFV